MVYGLVWSAVMDKDGTWLLQVDPTSWVFYDMASERAFTPLKRRAMSDG